MEYKCSIILYYSHLIINFITKYKMFGTSNHCLEIHIKETENMGGAINCKIYVVYKYGLFLGTQFTDTGNHEHDVHKYRTFINEI